MRWASMLSVLALASMAVAGEVQVRLPAGSTVATAAARGAKVNVGGEIRPVLVTFKDLKPNLDYDIRLTLTTGQTLQGVNLNWYSDEPPAPDAGPFTDDDRKEIDGVVKNIPSFYNKSDIVLLNATHDRAVALVQLVRDSDFHSNKGDEVIWRMELWYFKFQAGGWEKVQQQNKVLRRERYASRAEYEKAVKPIKWTPELGGIKLAKDEQKKIIDLSAPSTRPGE